MKKFFTLFCAVAIALSASAVPSLKGQKKGLKFDKELPQIENVKYQGVVNPLFKASKSIAKAPAAKKDVLAPSAAQAMYMGYYNYYMAGGALSHDWTLVFFAGDSLDYAGEVSFTSEAGNKINGEYEAAGYAVFAPGDTAEISAALRLTAVDFDGNYLVEIQATDASLRPWAFNDTIEVLAIDYLNFLYYQYGYAELYEIFITLDDYEIAPTGEKDTLVISAGRVNDQIEEQGWWVFGGYTADSVYVSLSNAGEIDHIIGTYAFADLDPEYSYVEIDGVPYYFSDAQFTITQADNNTYHAVGTAMAKNGIEYVITIDEEYIAPSENVITINYNTNSRALTFVPSVEGEYYFFYIVDKASLDEMVSEYSQDSLAPIVSSLVSYMIQQEVIGYYIDTTAISVSVPDFFGEYAETGDYVALAAPINNYGDVNGQIAHFEFHFDFPEALEDAKAEEKAIKKFENGQLIIEKNGVKYNAQGAILE